MSNTENSILYNYTLYIFECLIDKIQIFYLITTFHFLIFTSSFMVTVMFKLVLQTVKKQEKVKV